MDGGIDFDTAWKETLEYYLRPFMELCFPGIVRQIDWKSGMERLDKELEEIVRDANLGRQYVDKLFKVRRRDRRPEWMLVHVDVQVRYDRNLPRRLFQYNHRTTDRFGLPVVTLVAMADARKRWRPGAFETELAGCRTRFEYPVCKFLDFDMAELERRGAAGNAAALVVAAHRSAQATRQDMLQRKARKWDLVRPLYEKPYRYKDVLEIQRLIDWLMILQPDELAVEFRQELIRYEGERSMPYVTSYERIARQEGIAELIVRQARKLFPEFAPGDEKSIGKLPLDRLEALSEALLDFTGIADLRQWLAHT